LELRGKDSSTWIAVLAPSLEHGALLDELKIDLSTLLHGEARYLDLAQSTFDQLREGLHHPSDDIVILGALSNLDAARWSSLDLMRSVMERRGPIVLWLSMTALSGLSEYAPNIRSFIGASVFLAGPDGGIMTEEERQKRLGQLVEHYKLSNEEIVRMAEAKSLPQDPQFIEWLVLLGRGDLV
jgi:hypothetical protein